MNFGLVLIKTIFVRCFPRCKTLTPSSKTKQPHCILNYENCLGKNELQIRLLLKGRMYESWLEIEPSNFHIFSLQHTERNELLKNEKLYESWLEIEPNNLHIFSLQHTERK